MPVAAPRSNDIEDISDVQRHWLVGIENFFNPNKLLENKESYVERWKGADKARAVLRKYGLEQEWLIKSRGQ